MKNLYLLMCFMFICGCWSVYNQQEIWYDLYNYHYYSGWAFINGKTFDNLFVAGPWSLFNPLLDSMAYLVVNAFNNTPFMVFFINGMYSGVLYFLVFLLLKLFVPYKTISEKVLFTGLFFLSVSGFAVVRQFGVTGHETLISCFLLWAVYLFVKKVLIMKEYSVQCLFLIGFLSGIALGFKLTVFPICFAFGLMILFSCRLMPKPMKSLVFLCISACFGFLLTNGYWMYRCWEYTGNPIFPMANHIFYSPFMAPENFRDLHLMAQSLWQWLFYPFWSLNKDLSSIGSNESYLLQMVFPFVCAFTLGGILLCKRRKLDAESWIVLFWIIAYISWLFLFSILRYAIVLECFAGILFYLCIKKIPLKDTGKKVIGIILILLSCYMALGYPQWRKSMTPTYMPQANLSVADDTVLIVYNELLSYTVPSIKTINPVLGIHHKIWTDAIPSTPAIKRLYEEKLQNKKIAIVFHSLDFEKLNMFKGYKIYEIRAFKGWSGGGYMLAEKIDNNVVYGFLIDDLNSVFSMIGGLE